MSCLYCVQGAVCLTCRGRSAPTGLERQCNCPWPQPGPYGLHHHQDGCPVERLAHALANPPGPRHAREVDEPVPLDTTPIHFAWREWDPKLQFYHDRSADVPAGVLRVAGYVPEAELEAAVAQGQHLAANLRTLAGELADSWEAANPKEKI